MRAAQDAQVTLWAGTGAAQTVTSATNTFSDLLPGVIDDRQRGLCRPPSASPSLATTAPISDVANSLVTSLNDIFSFVSSKTAVSTSTDSAGGTVVTAGAFTGDSTVRDANQKLLSAASLPIDGISPSTYGISITRDGTITFDKDKFGAALAADPEKVKAAVQTIAGRVADAAEPDQRQVRRHGHDEDRR